MTVDWPDSLPVFLLSPGLIFNHFEKEQGRKICLPRLTFHIQR